MSTPVRHDQKTESQQSTIVIPDAVLAWLPRDYTIVYRLSERQEQVLIRLPETKPRHIDIPTICARDQVVAVLNERQQVKGFLAIRKRQGFSYLHAGIMSQISGVGEALYGATAYLATQTTISTALTLPYNRKPQTLLQLWGGIEVPLATACQCIPELIPQLILARPTLAVGTIADKPELIDVTDPEPYPKNCLFIVTRKGFLASAGMAAYHNQDSVP